MERLLFDRRTLVLPGFWNRIPAHTPSSALYNTTVQSTLSMTNERECVILSAGGSGYDLSNVYRPKRWGLQVVLRVFDSMAMGDQEQRWWFYSLLYWPAAGRPLTELWM